MDLHDNARLTPLSREESVRRVVEERQPPKVAAAAFGVCERTVRKWIGRFPAAGRNGLRDCSARPHSLHRPTCSSPGLRFKLSNSTLHGDAR